MNDPIRFLVEEYPARFAAGVKLLEDEAALGTPWAAERLEDLRAADGLAQVHVEGAGDVFLDVRAGALTASRERPEGRPRRAAISVDRDFAAFWMEEMPADDPQARVAVTLTASGRAEEATRRDPMRFHVRFSDVPELGDRAVRVVLGADEDPPSKPAFAVHLDYAVVEDLRDGEITPPQLFTGGKLRFSGDYARALSLAMELARKVDRARKG